MNQARGIDPQWLETFCIRWRITELSIFGSTARGEARSDSDVDLLVSFAPGAGWTLLDHAQMQEELEANVGRPVDLVSRAAVERSPNPIRKRSILRDAEVLYAKR